MNINELIFSNKLILRLARHLLFWACFFVYTVFINVRVQHIAHFFLSNTYPQPIILALATLPGCIFSVYLFLNFLFPLLVKKKYWWFGAAAAVVLVLDCSLELYFYLLSKPYVCPDCDGVTLREKINIMGAWGVNVAFMLGAIALGIKFTKEWYLQQARNRMLARKKIANELKLLKSRIQPDFLFETLQALHNKITVDKTQAAELLLSFADLLSYMLYECDDDFVLVERELAIVKEFTALEKVTNQIDLLLKEEIFLTAQVKFIPSFILISLIQNICVACAKNQLQNKSSVTVEIYHQNNYLCCDIHIQSKNTSYLKPVWYAIINALIDRLQTLFEDSFKLHAQEKDEDEFSIYLSLLLLADFPGKNPAYVPAKIDSYATI